MVKRRLMRCRLHACCGMSEVPVEALASVTMLAIPTSPMAGSQLSAGRSALGCRPWSTAPGGRAIRALIRFPTKACELARKECMRTVCSGCANSLLPKSRRPAFDHLLFVVLIFRFFNARRQAGASEYGQSPSVLSKPNDFFRNGVSALGIHPVAQVSIA